MTDEKSPEKIGVLCPDHGLHYNPETSSGCVLCNREKRSGPARLLILVVLAGVLIGTVHLCLRQEPAAASGSPAASAVPVETAPSADPLEPASARLSPVPYRPQIEELEAVLYRESPPGRGGVFPGGGAGTRAGRVDPPAGTAPPRRRCRCPAARLGRPIGHGAGRGIRDARILTVSVNETGVPFAYQRETHFEQAQTRLRQAEAYLDRLGL